MSDNKLNVLDFKKILIELKLYKPRMTLIEMEHVYYSYKCKQAIEAEGLYENGMSDQDIKQIYNTLKKSEETADNDNEYHELLNRTETNCSNIDMLIEESNTMNDETVDVTSVQTFSPKTEGLSKSYLLQKPSIKDINVLMKVKTNYPLLKLPKVNYSNSSLIYYHQTKILDMPFKERVAEISQYLLNINTFHKNNSNSKIKWSNAIQPQKKNQFNGDFCIDFIPDPPEEYEEEIVDSAKNIENEISVKNDSYTFTRSKRVVKRKNYIDQLSEDEDDFTVIKKTKSSDDLNSSNDNSTESKWIKKKKKIISKPPSYFSSGSDRINKIFNKLKWDDNPNSKTEKKNTAQSLQDTLNLSDSDEDCFPTKEIVTTANIHKEEDQAIKNKNTKTKSKKTSPKKRTNFNKLNIQKNSSSKENESPEIPTLNFYTKNKNTEVSESNNNKLENNEKMTNCPICNRPFHISKIEAHASNCMQYEGGKNSETFCDICNENIPDKQFQSHRYECLKTITESSTVVNKPVTRSQQRIDGFLCQVCYQYVINTSEIQHASSCIAEV